MQNSTQAANAWRILFLLFLANLFNFFDRTIPAIIIEPIRMEWHLSDFQLGIIGTAFTIVYAIAFLFGVGSAFWGLVGGAVTLLILNWRK